MKAIYVLFFLLLLPSISVAATGPIRDSTCRISIDTVKGVFPIGTGTVFFFDDDEVFVLTAGHVVEVDALRKKSTLHIEFFSGTTKSHRIPAKIVWYVYTKGTTHDLGVIKAKKADFKNWPVPKSMLLAPKDHVLSIEDQLFSCGCPGGVDPYSFYSNVKSISKDEFLLTATIIPGHSGSAVYSKDGIIGVIVMTDGKCVPIEKIYREINKRKLE